MNLLNPSKMGILTALLTLAATNLPAVDFTTFITTNTPSIPAGEQGEADDPDKDGIPSVIEYLVAGMNPGISDAGLMPEPSVSGGNLIYTVTKRAGIEGLTTAMEIYDVSGNKWDASSNVVEDASTITLTETLSGGPVLARISAGTSGCTLPANNPIAQAYPVEYCSGEYAWTDAFNWDNEVDVATFGAVADGDFANSTGTDNTGAFQAAMAVAAQTGGGVVRVGAGVYYIGDHLLIPPGVVIRGADLPQGQDSGRDQTLNPPTKLVFPKVDGIVTGSGNVVAGGPGVGYKRIYSDAITRIDANDTDPIDVTAHSTIGLVNLDINRASIVFAPPIRNPIKDGSNWVGAAESLILDPFVEPVAANGGPVGQNFIVYGVRSNNAAIAEGADGVNTGTPNSNQLAWQRVPFQFNANIRIMSGGNAIVANCSVNDLSALNDWKWGFAGETAPTFFDDSYEQPGYLIRDSALGQSGYWPLNGIGMATFRHTAQYSVSLNGLYMFAKAGFGVAPNDPDGNGGGFFGSPSSAPWLFQEGHVLRDNYIYGNTGARMEASGQGLVIDNNVVRDDLKKGAFLGSQGTRAPRQGVAFISRGLLIGGFDVTTTNNDIIATQHQIGQPSTQNMLGLFSNDAETIMMDNTTTRVNGWNVSFNKVSSRIFAYDPREIDNVDCIGNDWYLAGQTGTNASSHSVWIHAIITDKNPGGAYAMNNVRIEDNTNMRGKIIQKGNGTGSGNTFKNNDAQSATSHDYFVGDLNPATDISGNTNITSNAIP